MLMHVGLFFGSFNPIHFGHLALAEAVLEHSSLNQVWFVVSPHNPHKQKGSLLHAEDRYQMVKLAIEDNGNFRASDIEFFMPQPSFTIDTLLKLKEKYPQHRFSVIMGEDNLQNFAKWKSHEDILASYQLLIYPRPNVEKTIFHKHSNVQILPSLPQFEISATYIRNNIKQGKSVKYLLPDNVLGLIKLKKFYQN